MKKNLSFKKGYTLMELCIAIVLIAPVLFIAVNLMTASTKGFVDAETELLVTRQDNAFVSKVNDTIRRATTLFTIPEKSFNEKTLTQEWNYIGIMQNVKIPASVSRTGQEIQSEEALVYLESVGKNMPSNVPEGANLISTKSDGYFIQHVLAHSYTDSNGIKHDYSLVFKPKKEDKGQRAVQELTYEFVSILTKDGKQVGDGKAVNINDMLSSLNAVQAVYQGSDTNPAVALAFRPFLPTSKVILGRATITLVADLSSSMYDAFNNQTIRIDELKKAAKNFLASIADKPNIDVLLVPFGTIATENVLYGGFKEGLQGYETVNKNAERPKQFLYNAQKDKEKMDKIIDSLAATPNTNVGDGLRIAYHELKKQADTDKQNGITRQHFLVVLTDGEPNTFSVTAAPDGSNGGKVEFYKGNDLAPYAIIATGNTASWQGNFKNGVKSIDKKLEVIPKEKLTLQQAAKHANDYIRLWIEEIRKLVNPDNLKTYFINMDKSTQNKQHFKNLIKADKILDVQKTGELQKILDEIQNEIREVMWAFEGPRLQ